MITQDSLDALDAALERFHHYREVFRIPDVRPNGFSLPRQHSLKHYRRHIENFGAPNGLCSSITESKHITAVKKPWRRSSRFEALKQMLIINTRNDKLAAARANFTSQGMLHGTLLGEALRSRHHDPGIAAGGSSYNEDDPNGLRGGGDEGRDLDLDNGNNEENIPPDLVERPPIFSEVILALKKGLAPSHSVRNVR